MKTHNLIQGTQEWHDYRAKHFNASDAPAMLGISQYKTRSKLLQEMATGISQEFDAATERRFADGHRFEALARPIAEQIIGADLYPITASEGKLSASFDGLTLDETICFEHKTLNKNKIGEGIAEEYRAQMEQQLMISGAEKCLFMASKWDENDVLIEERHAYYVSDQAMRDRIVQGWVQFTKDLEGYQHVDAIPVAIATPIRDLPVITYQMNGMAVLTNLHADVKPAIVALVEKSKQPLETDQDFADLDLLCKHFADAEDQCKLIAAQVDAEFKDTDKFKKDLKELQELMAAARIAGKKRVTTEKETRKLKIMLDAREIYLAHVAALEAEIKPITLNLAVPDFALAIKGMAKLDNMKSKCSDLVASGKIVADTTAKDFRAKLAWCKENAAGHSAIFPDLQNLMSKPLEDFALLITSRIDKHKADEAARLEAERAKMQAEATAKAEREAAATLAAEEARIRAEEQAKAKAEAEQIAAGLAAKHEAERVESLRLALEAKAKIEAELKTYPEIVKEIAESVVKTGSVSAQFSGGRLGVINVRHSSRPSDQDIIGAIQNAFGASYGEACDWLLEVAESLKVAA